MTRELNETYMHVPSADEDSVSKISYEEIIKCYQISYPGLQNRT